MPQKPLKVKKTTVQKKQAANRHGKAATTTKKGKMSKPPKRAGLTKQHAEEKELTKLINAKNEGAAAGKANTGGGELQLIKAPARATVFGKKKVKGRGNTKPSSVKPATASKGDAMES